MRRVRRSVRVHRTVGVSVDERCDLIGDGGEARVHGAQQRAHTAVEVVGVIMEADAPRLRRGDVRQLE
jgi:hypothetical protein